jgi:hypothetical protein
LTRSPSRNLPRGHRWLQAVGCVGLIAAAVLVPAASAAAAGPGGWGYWSQGQSGVGPLVPAPPIVPTNGLWVANDPTGAYAVSAIRAAVLPTADSVTLTLNVAKSTGTPALVACLATTPWSSTGNGAWSDRPQADCRAGHVAAGVVSAATQTWSFVLTPLARGGSIDVVLEPGPSDASPWSVAFQPPDAKSLTIKTSTPPSHLGGTGAAPAGPPSGPVPPANVAAPTPAAAPTFSPAGETTAALPPLTQAPTLAQPASGRSLSQPRLAGALGKPGHRAPMAPVLVLVVALAWAARVRAVRRPGHTLPLSRPLVQPAAQQ